VAMSQCAFFPHGSNWLDSICARLCSPGPYMAPLSGGADTSALGDETYSGYYDAAASAHRTGQRFCRMDCSDMDSEITISDRTVVRHGLNPGPCWDRWGRPPAPLRCGYNILISHGGAAG
jgi:hypothetical protein